jgi:pimeloyl-ACP methyl ester carboxylesterase
MDVTSGFSKNGLPYTRVAGGSRTLVVFDGLDFTHKPPSGFELSMMRYIKQLNPYFTIYQVRRRPGLPEGYSIKDMADDYAVMVRDEFGGPVDIMGLSTGGTIAQQFAADHGELVGNLVLAMTGCKLNENGKRLQLGVAELVKKGKLRSAAVLMSTALFTGVSGFCMKPVFWLMGGMMFNSAAGPNDGLVEIAAEDAFDFSRRLKEIKAPTLLIGGDRDFFYDIKETAEKFPSANLVLYPGIGHMAVMKRQFTEDLLAFLILQT